MTFYQTIYGIPIKECATVFNLTEQEFNTKIETEGISSVIRELWEYRKGKQEEPWEPDLD